MWPHRILLVSTCISLSIFYSLPVQSTDLQVKKPIQPPPVHHNVPDSLIQTGRSFLRDFESQSGLLRHPYLAPEANLERGPVQSWEVQKVYKYLKSAAKAAKGTALEAEKQQRFKDFETLAKIPDINALKESKKQAALNKMYQNFDATDKTLKSAVTTLAYEEGAQKLTHEMMLHVDKGTNKVLGVFIAANIHSSDYTKPVEKDKSYPASKPDIQDSEENLIKNLLDKYPAFKDATVVVVRDAELQKKNLNDVSEKAKEFHGEMRFVKLLQDYGLLRHRKHSEGLAILANKNYCAGGKNSCRHVLSESPWNSLAIADDPQLSTFTIDNPQWKKDKEISVKVVQTGENSSSNPEFYGRLTGRTGSHKENLNKALKRLSMRTNPGENQNIGGTGCSETSMDRDRA